MAPFSANFSATSFDVRGSIVEESMTMVPGWTPNGVCEIVCGVTKGEAKYHG